MACPRAMNRLLPLLLLLCWWSLLTATTTNAEEVTYFYTECVSDTNYTRGGAFQANLEAVLSFLPSAAAASWGFAENVTGVAPDQAYGLAQCRRDASALDCSKCVVNLAQKLRSGCQGLKSAIALASPCMLRYSNVSFFGDADSRLLVYYTAPLNATEPELFLMRLDELMTNLTWKAAHGNPRMFAVGTVNHTPLIKIYGMAQCTGNLSSDDCYSCLNRAQAYIPTYWDRKQGGQANLWSCFVRFESALFYNVSAAELAMSSNYSNHLSQGSTGSKRTDRTALLVSIPVAVTLLVVVLLVALYLGKRNRKLHKHSQIVASGRHEDDYEDGEMRSSESLLYDLSILRAATDNFSEENKLGEGGFGPVYKGILQNGQEIAVKRLSTTSQQGQVEMKNEVVLVAKLQHKNLVRILGCCIQEHERLLIYEFLSNNSLDKILFDPARQQELSWGQRHKIIAGIGRGLLYLHEDSRLTIIHRDLKASNILLDKDMNPKISDFGLAKLFNVDSSVGNTSRIAGTYGYMAPEYALHGIFSAKSDVFSYGVLVLEIVTGRRNVCTQPSGRSEDLLTFVWRCWRRGSVGELLDGCPAEGRQPQEVLRFVHVGLLCVQEDPQLRPGMASVVIMLNSRSITLPAPTAPAFTFALPSHVVTAVDATGRSTDREGPRAVARDHSINEASVSDLEPR